jgi:hypothetical protein
MPRLSAVILAFLILALPERARASVEVDLELVLAVDISRSMSPRELAIQRRGYVEALRSPEVLGAIRRGLLGRIGLTYVEWAGVGTQRVVMDWTMIASEADALAFADAVEAAPTLSLRRTSISGVLEFAGEHLAASPFTSWRQVVDVSGDGPNNHGGPVVDARDALVARGVTINGLPLMTRDGTGNAWHLDDLDVYYANCVIGGAGAFVVPVLDWMQFAAAVRRKMVLEISGSPPDRLRPAQFEPADGYDCMIGERIWQQNQWAPAWQ